MTSLWCYDLITLTLHTYVRHLWHRCDITKWEPLWHHHDIAIVGHWCSTCDRYVPSLWYHDFKGWQGCWELFCVPVLSLSPISEELTLLIGWVDFLLVHILFEYKRAPCSSRLSKLKIKWNKWRNWCFLSWIYFSRLSNTKDNTRHTLQAHCLHRRSCDAMFIIPSHYTHLPQGKRRWWFSFVEEDCCYFASLAGKRPLVSSCVQFTSVEREQAANLATECNALLYSVYISVSPFILSFWVPSFHQSALPTSTYVCLSRLKG